jgi:hypothetical protein
MKLNLKFIYKDFIIFSLNHFYIFILCGQKLSRFKYSPLKYYLIFYPLKSIMLDYFIIDFSLNMIGIFYVLYIVF